MPGKRSAGVTFWAIVLILGGISTAVGAVVSVAVGPNIMRNADQRLAQLQTQLEAALEKQQQQQEQQQPDEELSSSQAAQIQAQLKQTLGKVRETYRHLRELYETPNIRIAFLIGGLLGVAALIGGIGVLRLREWGRTVVLWQAGLSIIYGVVWWMMWSSQQQSIVPDLSSLPSLPNLHPEATLQAATAVGKWIGLLFPVAWNGFVLWFFSRQTLKAQFQQV